MCFSTIFKSMCREGHMRKRNKLKKAIDFVFQLIQFRPYEELTFGKGQKTQKCMFDMGLRNQADEQ